MEFSRPLGRSPAFACQRDPMARKKAIRKTRRVSASSAAGAPSGWRRAAPYVALWCAALAIRGWVLGDIGRSPVGHHLFGDSLVYDDWAGRIADGDWLGDEVFYQAPLYPYFLAVLYRLIGLDSWSVRYVQAALGATSCIFLALAGREFHGRRAGLAAGALLAVSPAVVFFDGIIQKAVLDLFFLTAALWCLGTLAHQPRRYGVWALCGVVLGAMTLTRENTPVLLVVVLVWLAVRFRCEGWAARTTAAGLLLAGLAAVLAPVAIRNYVVGGEWHVTTSQFGPNFYIGNNSTADGRYRSLVPGRGNASYEREDARTLAEAATGRSLSPAEVSAYWADQAFDFIRREPVGWLALLGRKWLLVWNAGELADTDDQYAYGQWSPLLRMLTATMSFGTLLALALGGVSLCWSERRDTWLVWLLALAYAGSVALFFVFARYRLPLVPILALPAGAGLCRAVELLRQRQSARLRLPAVAAGLGLAVAFAPLVDRDAQRSATLFNLGVQAADERNFEQAERFYRQALALNPNNAHGHTNLGALLSDRGEWAAAIEHFDQAIALDPSLAPAHHNRGRALLSLGRHPEGEAELHAAIHLNPRLVEVYDTLGNLRIQQGKPAEALEAFRSGLAVAPDRGDSHTNVGVALATLGRHDEAEDHYRQAIAKNPRLYEAHFNLGNLLASQQRWSEAAVHYSAAAELQPRAFAPHLALGIVHLEMGQIAQADAALRAALARAAPGSAEESRAREALAALQSAANR